MGGRKVIFKGEARPSRALKVRVRPSPTFLFGMAEQVAMPDGDRQASLVIFFPLSGTQRDWSACSRSTSSSDWYFSRLSPTRCSALTTAHSLEPARLPPPPTPPPPATIPAAPAAPQQDPAGLRGGGVRAHSVPRPFYFPLRYTRVAIGQAAFAGLLLNHNSSSYLSIKHTPVSATSFSIEVFHTCLGGAKLFSLPPLLLRTLLLSRL